MYIYTHIHIYIYIYITVQNRTHVYMNFFDHKGLGNHLLQLCPKVVKHPVYIHTHTYRRFEGSQCLHIPGQSSHRFLLTLKVWRSFETLGVFQSKRRNIPERLSAALLWETQVFKDNYFKVSHISIVCDRFADIHWLSQPEAKPFFFFPYTR